MNTKTMSKFIHYNKTPHFHDAIRELRKVIPQGEKVILYGTVKLHGTNAGIVFYGENKEHWHCQSRNRIITPQSDNYGFATWVHSHPTLIQKLQEDAKEIGAHSDTVSYFGEWAGKGVFDNVGIGKLLKKWYIFIVNSGTEENPVWDNPPTFSCVGEVEGVSSPNMYKSFNYVLDPHDPVEVANCQNYLATATKEVEERCPVAAEQLPNEPDLIGEGIVWRVYRNSFDLTNYFFKTKGEKHSASKVKTIAEVDPNKAKSVSDFVDYAVTENRLNQGIEYLKEMHIEFSPKSTGVFLKWVADDVISEELNSLMASNLEPKDVTKHISSKAKEFWFSFLKENT